MVGLHAPSNESGSRVNTISRIMYDNLGDALRAQNRLFNSRMARELGLSGDVDTSAMRDPSSYRRTSLAAGRSNVTRADLQRALAVRGAGGGGK